MKVTYLTGNAKKFEAAKYGLEGSGIELEQAVVDVPEVQSDSVEEVCKYKAKYAAEKLGKAVVVTDAGCAIKILKGFPGPFLKFINQWFTAQDLVDLMKNKKDRSVDYIECLAYCEPGKEPTIFVSLLPGTIAEEVGPEGMSPFTQVYIPEGFDKPASSLTNDELMKFWGKAVNWDKFRDYIRQHLTAE